jgi:hypothetical protein
MQCIDKLRVLQCTTNPQDENPTDVANAEVGKLYLAVDFFLVLSFARICLIRVNS